MVSFCVLRAVENHRSFVFATALGPSTIIDSTGPYTGSSAPSKREYSQGCGPPRKRFDAIYALVFLAMTMFDRYVFEMLQWLSIGTLVIPLPHFLVPPNLATP